MQYIEDKKFRSDLYYRISVAPINVPPLRERREDIPELMQSFMNIAEIQNKKKYTMTKDAQDMMMSYTWPGNIRELRNIIEYAAMMAMDGVIDASCLPPSILQSIGVEWRESDASRTLGELVKDFEKQEIRRVIERYGDTTEGKKAAAKELGISLSSLYAKLGK